MNIIESRTEAVDFTVPFMEIGIGKLCLKPPSSDYLYIYIITWSGEILKTVETTLKKKNFGSKCILHMASTYKYIIYLKICVLLVHSHWYNCLQHVKY